MGTRALTVMLPMVLLFCSGCDRTPSAPAARQPDEADAIIADTTVTDVEAIQRAVDLDPLWFATFGTPLWHKDRDRSEPDHYATRIDVDATGAPALFIMCTPAVEKDTATRTSSEGWTVDQERSMDMTMLFVKMDSIARVARVGAARRLRFIDLTLMKVVMTPSGEKPIVVLHAVSPRERFAQFSDPLANFYQTPKDMERAWTILLDDYGSLSVTPRQRR